VYTTHIIGTRKAGSTLSAQHAHMYTRIAHHALHCGAAYRGVVARLPLPRRTAASRRTAARAHAARWRDVKDDVNIKAKAYGERKIINGQGKKTNRNKGE